MLRFNPVATAIAIVALAASTASAQQRGREMAPPQGGPPTRHMERPMERPMGRPMVGPSGMDAASMLLAQTAELKLSDQQVTRLAAIARRTGERRTAMMASLDSLRTERMRAAGAATAAPGAATRAPSQADRDMMLRMRDQSHTDLRDALSVLTPDQLATSWEMTAARGGDRAMMRRPPR
jgi:hypothetical protein